MTNRQPLFAALFALAAGALWTPRAAHALPKFAQAEGKPCLYCHKAPIGNANNLNYRAKFYKAHNFSFAGFDDAAEAKKAGVEVGPEAAPPPKSLKLAADVPPAKTTAAPAPGPIKSLLLPATTLAAWEQSVYENAEATFAQDKDAIRVNITKKGDAPWHVLLTQHLPGTGGVSGLTEGKEYVLHFRAKADPPRTLPVNPQINRGDYHGIGLSENVALTTEWQTFDLPFTASGLDDTDNRLPNFQMAEKAGAVWIADVTLLPSAKPAAPPMPVRPLPPTPADPANVPDFGEATFDGIVFVKIPAGTFRRGTSDAQQKMLQAAGLWSPMDASERPAREIRITKPFFLGKYEVTQAEWKAVAVPATGDGKGSKNASPVNPSTFKGDDRPVETVSADEAADFVARLNKTTATGSRYRLPTEAEWEYAARAGGNDAPFGMGENKTLVTPENLGDYAWFGKNAANTTHPVGTKKPNAWGLHDLLGNVWEWCQDDFDANFYAAGPDADPVFKSKTMGDVAAERVLRGGCWFLDARAARAALRGGNLPTFKSQYAGFRLVREL